MQYPQQGWNNQGYPQQGFPGGAQGQWGANPYQQGGYGYPAGMYGQAPGMYPPGMYPPHGNAPGMYPGGAPGAYPPGMYGAGGPQQQALPPKPLEVKATVNPIEAMFGDKSGITQQTRARRISNPPPVQPTPQESKPAPRAAPNYNIDLSEDVKDSSLGVPGTPSSHTATATSSGAGSSAFSAGGQPPSSSAGGYAGAPPQGGYANGPQGGHPGPQHPGTHAGPPHPGAQAHPGAPGPQHPGQPHPGPQHPGAHPGPQHPGMRPPGAPPGAFPPGGQPGFPHGAPGQPYNPQFYGGYQQQQHPGGFGYAAAINPGSFFLPPTGSAGPTHGGLTPTALTPTPTQPSGISPSPITPSLTSQGSFQQGLLAATGMTHQSSPPATPIQPRPSMNQQATQQPQQLNQSAPLQPSSLHSSTPLQLAQPASLSRSNSVQQPSSMMQPGFSNPSTPTSNFNFPATAPLQHTSSSSSLPTANSFPTQFSSSKDDDWAGAEFTSTNTTGSDEFGFSAFQGATVSPAKAAPQLNQSQPQQKDLFGFDDESPATQNPAPPQPTPSNNSSSLDHFELAPSPVLSRSTKHLQSDPEQEIDFFGNTARQQAPGHVPSPTSSASDFDPMAEPTTTPPTPAEPAKPEPPKKQLSALDSMMENSLFKVTHKPPPMAAKAAATQAQPQQSQSQQQTPQKPAPPQPQLSAKRFDWSSANYRDIFAAEAEPTPPPPSGEQFEGFVSATGSGEDFEFGSFEGAASDPFASTVPSQPSPFGASASPQPSPFPADAFSSQAASQSLFPADATFGSPALSSQSMFHQSHQPDQKFSFPPKDSSSFVKPKESSFSQESPFPQETFSKELPKKEAPSSDFSSSSSATSSFQGLSQTELFSANHLAPNDHFGFAPSNPSSPSAFDSPFAPQTSSSPVTPAPAVINSSSSSSSPSLPPSSSLPPPSSYPNSEPAFGNFSSSIERRKSVPPTPANSVVKEQFEDSSPFGDQSEFGGFSGTDGVDSAPGFGDFFGQSKTSTPPTPANTVVQSDRQSSLLQFTFGDIIKEEKPLPALLPPHLRATARTASLPSFGMLKAPPSPAQSIFNPTTRRLSTAVTPESFGSYFGDNSARRGGAPSFTQADPAFGNFVNKSTSVPPTPANSVDKDGNNNNFFSDPFGTGAGAANPNSNSTSNTSTSSYDSILSKPLNTFTVTPGPSPSSSVIAPANNTKSNSDWGTPVQNDDYFGSPFGPDTTSPSPSSTPSSTVTSSSAPSAPLSSTPSSTSNSSFTPSFGSFDTSFGSAPVFPSTTTATPSSTKEVASSDEFGTFSSFGDHGGDFGDSEFGTFSSADFGTTDFGTADGFGTSEAFSSDSFSSPSSSSPSLSNLLQTLLNEERLEEAAECKKHIDNGTQPSHKEMSAWSSPNPSNATIAQLKQRLTSHTSQEKIVKYFEKEYEKQPLSKMFSVNAQGAVDTKNNARMFVTAVVEWQATWDKQLSSCATEVAAAHRLAAEICSSSDLGGWDPKKEIFSQEKWTTYFRALVEVYRVGCRAKAAAQHFHVPASTHAAKLDASWSVLTALLKVDDVNIDYAEQWDSFSPSTSSHSSCSLCHIPLSISPSEPSAPWDGHVYHLSCANVWANKVSPIPPHVKG